MELALLTGMGTMGGLGWTAGELGWTVWLDDDEKPWCAGWLLALPTSSLFRVVRAELVISPGPEA